MVRLALPVLGSFGFVGELGDVADLSEQDLADLSRCCPEELMPQVHLVDACLAEGLVERTWRRK